MARLGTTAETPTRNKDFAGTNASLKRFTSCFDSLEPCAGAQRSGHTSALAGAAVSQDTRHPREREGRASPAALTLIYRRERRKSSEENEGAGRIFESPRKDVPFRLDTALPGDAPLAAPVREGCADHRPRPPA